MRSIRMAAAAILALLATLLAGPALAADCGALKGAKIDQGEVVAADIVAAGKFTQPAPPGAPPPGVAASPYNDVPAFCRVQLRLHPSSDSDIASEVWLPVSGWNGKYVAIGNGIWAGQISYSQMGEPVTRGYVASSTDTGHQGNGLDASWAVGHPEKLIDFGYRAVHVTSVAAKQLIGAFYGRAPTLSFWDSCSTGGRQGLMAAHRYPEDFNAISAMAPANPMTDLMVQSMWAGWQAQRFGVQLTPATLALVHAAVLKQCDKLDGVEDGVVGRPMQCSFDPVTLKCAAGASEGCLSEGQVQAMANIYGGVRAADGSSLLPGWPRGAEMQLAVLVLGKEPFPVATSYFRQLVFAGKPAWDWKAMDYRADLGAARSYGSEMLDVPADGLGPFFARGGKLMLSHGWADGLIPATNTLAFNAALYRALPQDQAEQQLRLFMVPGMEHCGGGAGVSKIDTLGTIDQWATTGQAPTRIVATRPEQVAAMPGAPPQPPRPPMSRPLCAYPLVARYDGKGDPMTPAAFSCAVP